MGLFSKGSGSSKSSGDKNASGTTGTPGRGFNKGSATTNPDKYTPRTPAQQRRSDRAVDKWKG